MNHNALLKANQAGQVEPFGAGLMTPVEAQAGSLACLMGVETGPIDDDDQDAFRRMEPFEAQAPDETSLN